MLLLHATPLRIGALLWVVYTQQGLAVENKLYAIQVGVQGAVLQLKGLRTDVVRFLLSFCPWRYHIVVTEAIMNCCMAANTPITQNSPKRLYLVHRHTPRVYSRGEPHTVGTK